MIQFPRYKISDSLYEHKTRLSLPSSVLEDLPSSPEESRFRDEILGSLVESKLLRRAHAELMNFERKDSTPLFEDMSTCLFDEKPSLSLIFTYLDVLLRLFDEEGNSKTEFFFEAGVGGDPEDDPRMNIGGIRALGRAVIAGIIDSGYKLIEKCKTIEFKNKTWQTTRTNVLDWLRELISLINNFALENKIFDTNEGLTSVSSDQDAVEHLKIAREEPAYYTETIHVDPEGTVINFWFDRHLMTGEEKIQRDTQGVIDTIEDRGLMSSYDWQAPKSE